MEPFSLVMGLFGPLALEEIRQRIERAVNGGDHLVRPVLEAFDRAVQTFQRDHPFGEGASYHRLAFQKENLAVVLDSLFLGGPQVDERVIASDHLDDDQTLALRSFVAILYEELRKDRALEAILTTKEHYRGQKEVAEGVEKLTGDVGQLLQIAKSTGPALVSSQQLVEAIARSPLAVTEQEALADDAKKLAAEGDHAGSAEELLEIARALRERGFGPVAELYLQEAAGELRASGNATRANEILTTLTKSRIARCDMRAKFDARELVESLPEGERWRGEGLIAQAVWPEQEQHALDVLRAAHGHAAGTDEELYWGAAVLDLMQVGHMPLEAKEVAEEIRRNNPLSSGPRLDIELDYLDAIEATDGQEAAELTWQELLRWASDLAISPEAAGRTWQRRSVVASRRGDLDEARRATLQAISSWSRAQGNEDQVAEAFHSYEAGLMANGAYQGQHLEARGLVLEMRGSRPTSASLGKMLETRGTRALLAGKLPDALEALFLAYAVHRRAGNLRGLLDSAALLGQVYEKAGRPARAVRHYMEAGKVKEAAGVASGVGIEDLAGLFTLSAARWERAAWFSAISVIGADLTDDQVRAIAPLVIEEARKPPESPFSPQPELEARKALASMVCSLPPDLTPPALETLRDSTRAGYPTERRVSANALARVSRVGISDETEFLTELFLQDDRDLMEIGLQFIADEAAVRPRARALLLEAADSGNANALEVACVANLCDERPGIRGQCDRIAAGFAETQTVIKGGGEFETTIHITSFESAGIIGRCCSAVTRSRLVGRLVSIASNLQEPDFNRVSAVGALFNLAPAMDETQRSDCASIARPMALGLHGRSEWDALTSNVDPLSRFHVNLVMPDQLRISAIGLLAGIASEDSQWLPCLREVVETALGSDRPLVTAAALEALARVPLLDSPIPIEMMLQDPASEIRVAAVRAWCTREGTAPPEPALSFLLSDSVVGVRVLLANRATHWGETGDRILNRLQDDRNSYVRALVRALQNRH